MHARRRARNNKQTLRTIRKHEAVLSLQHRLVHDRLHDTVIEPVLASLWAVHTGELVRPLSLTRARTLRRLHRHLVLGDDRDRGLAPGEVCCLRLREWTNAKVHLSMEGGGGGVAIDVVVVV